MLPLLQIIVAVNNLISLLFSFVSLGLYKLQTLETPGEPGDETEVKAIKKKRQSKHYKAESKMFYCTLLGVCLGASTHARA